MRRLLGFGLFAAFVLVLGLGGWTILRSGPPAGPNVNAEIDARRVDLEQRTTVARKNGTLRGVGYFAVLDEQHRFLVKQRRAEANGLTPDARQQLLSDFDRASANLERHSN